MFTRILVPYDGSKGAMSALEKAVALQKLCDAELLILTVYRHHSHLEASLSMVRPVEPESMDDVLRGHAKEVAEFAKAEARKMGANNPRAFVKNGPIARGIVSFADDNDADLIVIGSRGHGSVEGYLLGSVSHKVTGLSEVPVMVV
jgi:nucleotide-binding universal stress UspA family protein